MSKKLKRSGYKTAHLHQVYLSMVRPSLEYALVLWHPAITQECSDNIEWVQRRALNVICPGLSYDKSLQDMKIESLHSRRYNACVKVFSQMKNTSHRLNQLLANERNIQYNLRKTKQSHPPPPSTDRKDSLTGHSSSYSNANAILLTAFFFMSDNWTCFYASVMNFSLLAYLVYNVMLNLFLSTCSICYT